MIKDVLMVAGALAILFAGLSGCAYVFQRNLIYFPDRSVPEFPAPFDAVSLSTRDGLDLASWVAAPKRDDASVIVYFHGNGGHAGYRADKMVPYLETGMGAMMVEYRGYGGNPGSPTESGLYHDAEAALAWLAGQNIGADRVILYGESLGAAVAVELATRHAVKAVVLEAPFTSLGDAGARIYPFLPIRWLALDHYDTISKIGTISAPLMVVHGERDQIVPADMGRALLTAAHAPKRGLFLPGLGHNDLIALGAPEEILQWLAELDL